MGPTAGQSFEYLASVMFAAEHRLAIVAGHEMARFIALRHTGLAEILLGQDIDRQLRPRFGDVDLVELKYGRSIRIAISEERFTNFKPS